MQQYFTRLLIKDGIAAALNNSAPARTAFTADTKINNHVTLPSISDRLGRIVVGGQNSDQVFRSRRRNDRRRDCCRGRLEDKEQDHA